MRMVIFYLLHFGYFYGYFRGSDDKDMRGKSFGEDVRQRGRNHRSKAQYTDHR